MKDSICSHISSSSPFKKSPHTLPCCRQPLCRPAFRSYAGVFRKPLEPLFCLRWILSLPMPQASTWWSLHIWGPRWIKRHPIWAPHNWFTILYWFHILIDLIPYFYILWNDHLHRSSLSLYKVVKTLWTIFLNILHYIPESYLFSNGKFVPMIPFTFFANPLNPSLWQP